MEQKSIVNEDTVFSVPQAPRIHISKRDILFAIALFLLSFIFTQTSNIFHLDAVSAILQIIVILACFIYINANYFITKKEVFMVVFLFACCIPNLFYSDYFLKFVNWCFIQVNLVYLFYSCANYQLKQMDSDWILVDIITAVCKVPLSVLSLLRNYHGFEIYGHQVGKTISLMILGCACSIPLLCIILPLLIGADPAFASFMHTFHLDLGSLFYQCILVAISLGLSSYLFFIAYGTTHFTRDELHLPKLEKQEKTLAALSFLPDIVLLTMEGILSLVYLLFLFISFQEILQNLHASWQTFSYSSFARNGFFQLCGVCVINLGFIFLTQIIRKKDKNMSFSKRILCIETLLLVISAMSKMAMYVHTYGLTPLRIYASWFMIVLFGIFCMILYRSFKKGPLILPIFRYICVCFFLLNIINTNGIMNHVNRYKTVYDNTYYVYDKGK